jgi:hypothetical protein
MRLANAVRGAGGMQRDFEVGLFCRDRRFDRNSALPEIRISETSEKMKRKKKRYVWADEGRTLACVDVEPDGVVFRGRSKRACIITRTNEKLVMTKARLLGTQKVPSDCEKRSVPWGLTNRALKAPVGGFRP